MVKYLYTLVSIRKKLDIPFRDAKEDDIKRFVAGLEKSDYAEWTKHDLKVILKKYLKWLGKDNAIGWMKIKSVKNGKLPEEVLTEEDIKAIAEATYTSRDKAFILSFYESGCRIGEFLPLKLKHLSFDKYGVVLRVTGKTGDRRIRLVATTLALQNWLNDHPGKNDPESYLWCKIPSDPASRFCKRCGLPLNENISVDRLEGLLTEFLNVIGESYPQVKDRFRAIVQEKGAENLFR